MPVCVFVCVCVCVYSVAQSCLTLCDPMDCNPPGFSVHGILQARTLELVAISFFRGSFRPSNQTHVSCISCIGRQILYHWATWEAPKATIDHPKMCDHGPVSIKLYSWTLKYEFHISFIWHQMLFFFWFFSSEFSNVKAILSSRAVQKQSTGSDLACEFQFMSPVEVQASRNVYFAADIFICVEKLRCRKI